MKKTLTLIAVLILIGCSDKKSSNTIIPTSPSPTPSPTVPIGTSIPPTLLGIDTSGPNLKLTFLGELIVTERQSNGAYQPLINLRYILSTQSIGLNFEYTYSISAKQSNLNQSFEVQITMPKRNPNGSGEFIKIPVVIPPCTGKVIEDICIAPGPKGDF